MKKLLLVAALGLVCGASFAQTTPAPGNAKAGSQYPAAQGTAATGTVGNATTAPPSGVSAAVMPIMDTNGDGMISRREYDRYNLAMWNKMRNKSGMVSKADMEAKKFYTPG